jgi:hypothetical protein
MSKRNSITMLLSLVCSAALVLSGCGGTTSPTTATSSDALQSIVAGYYSSDQSLSGGVDLMYINLRDIEITKQQADTVITLTFKDGSMQRGMKEEDTKGVPKYSTQWIGGINRFVININGLAYWDYKVWDDELKDTPILGIFNQVPVDNADTMLTKLYINLKDNISYKIEQKDNKLSLYLRVVPEEERTDNYVLLNAFDEYVNGKVSDDNGLLPTLCKDKTNKTLISGPFASDDDAKAFLAEINSTLVPSLPGTVATIVQLKNNELPDYDESGALNTLLNMPVTRSDGIEHAAEPVISNGRILCWKPGGMAYVFVTPFFLGGDSGEEATNYEKIYMNELGSTTPRLLSEFEYSHIIKAEFSDDGKYLAFLEQGDTSRSLYIYDLMSSSVPASAAEDGFGVDTADFTWGSGAYANSIFAITGENEMLQLMSYTMKDGSDKVQTLVEDAFTEGDISFFDGKIYYSQSGNDDVVKNGIFTFDPVSRFSAKVCDGDYFTMNIRTGGMAVLKIRPDNDQAADLNVYIDPRTKSQQTIEQNQQVALYVWSNDGSMLYYTLYKNDVAADDRYKLTLYQYSTLTKESSAICDIVEGDLNPSDKSSEILLTCLYPQDKQYVTITYRVSVLQQAG